MLETAKSLWQIGKELHVNGNLEGAINSYKKALTLPPDHPQIFIQIHCDLAEAYANLGDFWAAIASFENVLQQDPKSAIAHWSLGKIYEAQGWQELAMPHFSQALAAEPSNFTVEAHLHLGQAFATRGNWQEAIASYQRALQIDGYAIAAYQALGKAYIHSNQPELAWQLYADSQELEIELIPVQDYNNLGIAFVNLKKWDDAAKCFHKALEIQPDYADAHANLGNLFLQQNNIKEAILCFQEAIAIDPNFTEVYYNLGTALATLDRPADATVFLVTAIKLNPNFTEAYFNLGIALLKQNLIPEAIAAYQKTIDLSPYHPQAQRNLEYALLLSANLSRGLAE